MSEHQLHHIARRWAANLLTLAALVALAVFMIN